MLGKRSEHLYRRSGLLFFTVVLLLSFARSQCILNRVIPFQDETTVNMNGTVVEGNFFHGSNTCVIRTDDGLHYRLKGLQRVVSYGDFIACTAYFRLPDEQSNPGGFDEAAYFDDHGLRGELRLDTLLNYQPATYRHMVMRTQEQLRRQAEKILDELMGVEGPVMSDPFSVSGHGFLHALLLGDQHHLSNMTKTCLRESGIYHLICISGTHLTFFLLPFRPYLRRRSDLIGARTRKISGVVLLFLPGVLSGFGHGIARASLFACLAGLEQVRARRDDRLNRLALAGAFILLANPFAFRQAGFRLSFGAAVILFAARTPFEHAGATRMWYACTIPFFLLPLTLPLQHGINILSPLIHLAVQPMTAGLTVLGYLLLMIGLLFPTICPFLRLLFTPCLEFFSNVITWLSYRVARKNVMFLTTRQVLLWAAVLVSVGTVFIIHRCDRMRDRRWVSTVSAVCVTAIAVNGFSAVQADLAVERILFLDVGQGDATLFLDRTHTVLLDGGEPGMGLYTVLPAIRHFGRDVIDYAVLTHGHSDHAGGILELVKLGRVRTLVVSYAAMGETSPGQVNVGAEEDLTQRLIKTGNECGVPIRMIGKDETVLLGALVFEVHAPDDTGRAERDANAHSLAGRICFGESHGYVTGDLTREAEHRLVRSGRLTKTTWLHVAHHGSGATTRSSFLNRVQPDFAIISCGRNNRYGHPHERVLADLAEIDCRIFRTDEQGALLLNAEKGESRIIPWRERKKKR